MEQWEIALSTTVILDGNYDDFYQKQRVKFPLEFNSISNPEIYPEKLKSVTLLSDALYEIIGEIIYLSDNGRFWVIDFGIRAFGGGKPIDGIVVGATIKATIYLNVEEVSYFYYKSIEPAMPPIVYAWQVERIFIEPITNIKGTNLHTLAQKYQEIECTDAWKDVKIANYILLCTKLDVEPT